MKKSKFIVLVGTLTEREMHAFGKHVARLHGNNRVALAVLSYVRKLHPNLQDDKKLNIEHAYQKIFKEPLNANPQNRTKLLNTLSDLYLWLKEYLMLEKIKMESLETRIFWMGILKEKGLMVEYGRQAERMQLEMSSNPIASMQNYMRGMVSSYFYYYYLSHNKLSEDFKALENCGNNMDVFYAVSRLKIACEMANRKNQLSLEYNMEALPLFVKLSKSEHLSGHLLLRLYGFVYDLIANGQTQLFAAIETMLNEHIRDIETDELHIILSYLYNFASAQVRQGHDHYWNMAHSLNQFGVRNHIFEESGMMSPNQFVNIVNAACRVADFDWAYQFMKSHSKLIHPSLLPNTLLLAEAVICFEQRDFNGSLKLLADVSYTDLHVTIRSKSLALRCHVEIQNSKEFLENYCFSFESYLRRHRKPKQEVVEATLNFIQILKMIIKERTTADKLRDQIERSTPLYFKSWLIEKALFHLEHA